MTFIMRIVVLMACVAWASHGAHAAGGNATIVGRVVDRAGRPVAGASVLLPTAGTDVGVVVTDRNGGFVWLAPPTPPFEFIVVLPTGELARPILVETIQHETIVLTVEPHAAESVTIRAAEPPPRSAPATGATRVTAADMSGRQPQHLTQVLEQIVGVSQVSEGHNAVPAVRGLARGRTAVLLDGVKLATERRVGASASFVDPAIIDRVDVTRGPGSVAYGADAIGGGIAIHTRPAPRHTPLQLEFTSALGGGVPEHRGTAVISGGSDASGFVLQAHARRARDYDSAVGTVFNSGWTDAGLLARVSRDLAGGVLTTTWQSDVATDVGRPRSNSRAARILYPVETSHRLTTAYGKRGIAGLEQIDVTGFWGSHAVQTKQEPGPSTTMRTVEQADVTAHDMQLSVSARSAYRGMTIDFGAMLDRRTGLRATDTTQQVAPEGRVVSERVSIAMRNAARSGSGAFVQAGVPLSSTMRVSSGVRIDRVFTANRDGYFGDRRSRNGAVSGFTALTVDVAPWLSLTTQASRAFHDPTLSDRYYRGPSGRGFVTGNPDLRPESTTQFDVAVRASLRRTLVSTYLYDYRLRDVLERYQLDPDNAALRNGGTARVRGLELESRIAAPQQLILEVGASLVGAGTMDGRTGLDDVAPSSVFIGVRRESRRGHVEARARVYGAKLKPGPSEVATPSYNTLDVGGAWHLSRHLSVSIFARNLLNNAYRASADPRWVLAPGRSWSVAGTWRSATSTR